MGRFIIYRVDDIGVGCDQLFFLAFNKSYEGKQIGCEFIIGFLEILIS